MVEKKYLDDSYMSTFSPVEVKLENSSDDEFYDAVRRFRKLITKERIMSVLKEHASYEKPSDKRRRKIREQKQRIRKLERQKSTARDDINNFEFEEDDY